MVSTTTAAPNTDTLAEGLTWERLCTDPAFAFLQDLPFKIETNRWGQLVMSPTFFRHSYFQKRIIRLLDALVTDPGEAFAEVAVQTTDGNKVPDVVWMPRSQSAASMETFALPEAPPICVEVVSPGNHPDEIAHKRALYFEAGAAEVWICDREGALRFFTPEGEHERSPRVPGFPL
ncbi:MAG: Uma2 family endonuclease, partial [Bacteroidota bacterium]